jgi:hypothetical protein
MDRWRVAVASFVVGVALSASPTLAEDPVEALPDIAVAPEYTVNPPRDFADVKLASAGLVGSQSVAVNPKNANVFVSTYANQGTCWVRTSTDAGRTWAAAKKLPMPPAKQNCASGAAPAVLWAPDGSRIYAAYTYSIPLDSYYELGTVVSSSTNNGATWSVPVIATKYAEGEELPSVRLATPLRASDAKWVYLVSEFYWHVLHSFNFVRSSDMGKTWSVKQSLNSFYSTYDGYDTSPSIAGGLGGEVLVAWGNWDYEPESFYIAVTRSTNYGSSFSPPTTTVPNAYGGTAVAFGNSGVAHIVYNDSWSQGGVFYTYSTKAPRTKWAMPIKLNDKPAHGYRSPALFVNACGGNASVLHVVWSDDRVQTDHHNVYYTRKVAKTGETWSSNLRVSGRELQPPASAAIAAGSSTALGVWGTRYFDSGLPAWASRIAPGVSCP